jgi:hypothetical protein
MTGMVRSAFLFSVAAVVLLTNTGLAIAQSTYLGSLSGTAENPPVASPGTGSTTVTYDATTHTLGVQVSFSGLLGATTAAHIHCCVAAPGTVGVATQTPTFAVFPLGVTSGTYSQTFDLTLAASFNPSFVTANGGTPAGAEAALVSGLNAGQAYLNVHTVFAAGGEIRSFLELRLLPVPATGAVGLAALAAMLGLAGVMLLRRR